MSNAECSCPNGWGGYFCEIATNKFSLPSFNGKSYMIVPSQRYTHKDKRNGISSQYNTRLTNKFLLISLNFSTISTDGMLLWNDKDGDYLGIGIESGFLKVVSNLLNFKDEVIDVPTGVYLTDGGWHNIKLELDEKGQTSLLIDHKLVYHEIHSSDKIGNLDQLGDSFFLGELLSFSCLSVLQSFTLPSFVSGGFPNPSSISNRTLSHFHKPFSGCLQDVQISNFGGQSTKSQALPPAQFTTLNMQDFSTFEGANIGECELLDEFVNTYNNV